MSLKFYVGEENIPKDKRFVNDIESFFMLQCRLGNNEAARRVMKIIDKAAIVLADVKDVDNGLKGMKCQEAIVHLEDKQVEVEAYAYGV